MTIEEKVISAQENAGDENQIIKEYIPFIVSCANKASGKYITREDDEFSVALCAFHEAVMKYELQKGSYLSFARLVIKNRITDYRRKEYNYHDIIPFSALEFTDEDGETGDFDIAVSDTVNFDIKYEIEALNYELSCFDITFFDVSKSSPKSAKTKQNCREIVNYILADKKRIEFIRKKKYIPAREIISDTGVNKQIIERHRNYIIAVVLVMSGEYETIQGQISQLIGGKMK